MKDRQERVKAEVTIRKFNSEVNDENEYSYGLPYIVVVEFGEKVGRVAKFFRNYEVALLYANESSQFLWGEDYKDEMA